MMFLGLLGCLQLIFIPGSLCLTFSRWQAKSALQFLVYAFATSLIFNFCFVWLMTSVELYTPASVYSLLAAEALGGLWLLKERRFALGFQVDLTEWSRQWVEHFRLKEVGGCILFGLAVATLLAFARLIYVNFGSVFILWDDTLSWDRWAEQWASNRFPIAAGYYPQLMPANWSITYQIIRNTDVKMFAKAVMPLFPIAAMMLFLDLAARRKSREMLFSIALYGLLLYMFLGVFLIMSGYMETALAFFGWLTVYALVELSEDGPTVSNVLLASLFAGATALVKQGGLYMVVLSTFWIGIVLYRRRAELGGAGELGRMACAAAAGVILVLPWYARQYASILRGDESSNISYLVGLTALGRKYSVIVQDAIYKFYTKRQGFAKPFCWFLLVTGLASLADPKGRKVFVWVLAPVLVLWALFFSYDVRTASVAYPFFAYCSGVGSGIMLRPFRRRLPGSWKLTAAGGLRRMLAAVACLVGLSAVLYSDRLRTLVTVGWQPERMADVKSLWAIPLAIAAIGIAGIVILARRPHAIIPLNGYALMAIALCVGLGTTTESGADIVRKQMELQKKLGSPSLNQAMYGFLQREGLHGKIATDYWVFDRLPVLRNYYASHQFPLDTSVEHLRMAAAQPGVCYMLIDENVLAPNTKKALAEGLFRTIVIDSGYRLIQTCIP
jgi:hypothetical protein